MDTRKMAAEYRLRHWAQIMRERKESGLSVKAYCEQAGFHENNYFYWQRKLRESASEQLAAMGVESTETGLIPRGFAEVKLQEEHMRLQRSDISGQIRIETVGVQINTDSTYPVDRLAALLKELARS